MATDQSNAAARYLAAIIESSDDAVVGKTIDGIITSWNPAAERIFGFTAAEVVGRSIRLIIPPDRQGEEDEVIRRICAGETVDHFETMRLRKDGALIPLSITTSPIRDATGTVVGASKIARDISFRKQAEATLAASERTQQDLRQRLLTLVAASSSLLESPRIRDVLPATLHLAGHLVAADGYAIWHFDRSERKWHVWSHAGISEDFASAVIVEQAGIPVAPLASSEPIIATNVDSVNLIEERRAAYAREGIRSMLAIPLLLGEERTASLAFYYRTLHDFPEVDVQTAQALGNLSAAAIRTAELYEEQRQAQQRADFMAQASKALGASLDYRESLTTLANLAVPHIADWCAVDVLGDDGELERLAVAHIDPARIALATAFEQRYPRQASSKAGSHHVMRTGQSVLVERLTEAMLQAGGRDDAHRQAVRELGIASYMCVPLRTREGPRGTITFVSAESGRHYTASDLRFAETVADQAGLAMDNAHAYDEAQQANRLKDDFLATLSHELRTPLNAILGYTRLVRSGAISTDKLDSALETIERNATSLAQIVEDVLDVSRIVSAKLRLRVEAVRIGGILEEAVETLRPAADAKGLVLETAIDEAVDVVSGDPERLRQVFWNMLSNAVKFTPVGGRIAIALRQGVGHLDIEMSDSGRGIAPEFLPFVFDRFRQGDSRFTREHGGLGLGLSIARHIVELHGGTIRAESGGEGRGATFRVRLPVRSRQPGGPIADPTASQQESPHG